MASEYINEHELALMLSIGRNCRNFGEPARECTEEARKIFDEAYQNYKKYMQEFKGNKSNPLVQENFKKALEVSPYVEPTQHEVARAYELILLLCRRCLRAFGRNSHLSEDELGSLAFERWVRYRENFDPLKRSAISGNRVNAFAYLTSVVKNIIYGEYHQHNKEVSSDEVPEGVLGSLVDSSILGELEECKDLLLKESLKCTDFEKCLKNIAKKHEIEPSIIIKTVVFYDLKPKIDANILANKWDF